jgi:ankyrin repeat protein
MACHEGALGVVKRLVGRGLNPKKGNAAALRAACDGNSTRIILHLLKLNAVTPDALDLALLHSVHANNLQVLRAILRRVDFHPPSDVFVFACRLQRLAVVELLVDDPRINPRVDRDAGLLTALRNEDADMVNFLMRHPRTKVVRLDPAFERIYATIESPHVAQLIYALA